MAAESWYSVRFIERMTQTTITITTKSTSKSGARDKIKGKYAVSKILQVFKR